MSLSEPALVLYRFSNDHFHSSSTPTVTESISTPSANKLIVIVSGLLPSWLLESSQVFAPETETLALTITPASQVGSMPSVALTPSLSSKCLLSSFSSISIVQPVLGSASESTVELLPEFFLVNSYFLACSSVKVNLILYSPASSSSKI